MGSPGKSWKVLLLSSILLWFTLPAVGQSELPEGEGKEIVEIVCSQCHDLNSVTDSRLTPEEWQNVVSDMVARGAPLLLDEIDIVSAYLTENFGPEDSSENSPKVSPPDQDKIDASNATPKRTEAGLEPAKRQEK